MLKITDTWDWKGPRVLSAVMPLLFWIPLLLHLVIFLYAV